MNRQGGKSNPNAVKTTETIFSLLEAMYEGEGARVTELANEVEMAKSTVHRHLSTLEGMEYLVKEGDTYHLSARFLELGMYAWDRKDAYSFVRPRVNEIAEETEERAQFIIEEHGQAIYLFREKGKHAVQTDPGIGSRVPIHVTAAGKAILAFTPEQRVEEIIDQRGLEPMTNNSITEPEELFQELKEIRERGYSLNMQEGIEGLRAVGAPIKGPDGMAIGALSVGGPTHRLKGARLHEELPDLLLGTTNELELNIAHS